MNPDEIYLISLAAAIAAAEEAAEQPAPVYRPLMTQGGGEAPAVAPLFLSAEIGTVEVDTLAVTFDSNVSASNYATGVTIKVNDETQAIESATRQANHAVVYYVIDDIFIVNSDAVTWEYTGGNIVSESGGAALATVTAQAVTNNEEIMKATVTLTDTQIKALPATGVQVIAAPGANKVILPLSIFVSGDLVAYTNIGDRCLMFVAWGDPGSITSAFGIFMNDPVGGFSTVTQLLAGGAATMGISSPAPYGAFSTEQGGYAAGSWSSDGAENKSIIISADNYDGVGFDDLGNFTGGDAANALKVTVIYQVISL